MKLPPAHDNQHPEGHDDAIVDIVYLAEARLHARAADGERDAIDAVWRRNRRWIASVLAAHAPRGTDIEDLLQEVAATFVAKAREIRDSASVRGWLRVVAVNAARMAARSRNTERRSLARLAGLGVHNAATPDFRTAGVGAPVGGRGQRLGACVGVDPTEDARETLALLSRLPAQYAEPLILQVGQGFSQREIAQILDVPETTVETRLARARRMLRQIVEEMEQSRSKTTEPKTSMTERSSTP
ncbi:MAG: RNA polymerase sigma factor [bacterium]